MFSHYAYMHESGNYGFNVDQDDSKHFIVTAILLEAEKYSTLESELKWLMLGLDQDECVRKQEQLLEDLVPQLLNLHFGIYVLVMNKQKLREDGGFGSQDSMFTYANELLYQGLFENHLDIQVQTYQTKTPFMQSFESYIDGRQQPNLFNHSVFSFTGYEDDVFMQLTKLLGDVILAKFERKEASEDDLIKQLSKRILRLEVFPIIHWNVEMNDEIDDLITKQAIDEAQQFIHTYEKSQLQVNQDRVNFLKFLLTQLSIRPNEYIYSQEIIQNMLTFSKDPISKEYLMTDIIGPLRDAGVLIASTTKGYKIPTSIEDLQDYVEFSSSIAIPMLRRIEKSRKSILTATNNQIDILENKEFGELRRFFG